jgi:hypothetical protein
MPGERVSYFTLRNFMVRNFGKLLVFLFEGLKMLNGLGILMVILISHAEVVIDVFIYLGFGPIGLFQIFDRLAFFLAMKNGNADPEIRVGIIGIELDCVEIKL